MKTNLMLSATSATSAVALSLLMLHPTPAHANDCNVKAADAYRAAVKKGWQFQCVTGSQTLPGALPINRLHVDYPGKGSVSCFLNSLPSPVPPVASLRFFRNTSFTSTNGGLHNGWRLKPDWSLQRYRSVSGKFVQANHLQFSKCSNATNRVCAQYTINEHGTSFAYALVDIVLTKPGGVCSKALDEAF